MTDDNLFEGFLDADAFEEEETVEGRHVRSKKEYQAAYGRSQTRREQLAGEESIFDFQVTEERPSLDELYGTMDDVRAVAGTNGLKSVSLFSGSGASETGFAMAGFQNLLAVEFVKSARETIAANYESYLIEPELVTEVAEAWLAENVNTKMEVVKTGRKRIKGIVHDPIIDWAATMEVLALRYKETGDEDIVEELPKFRYAVTKAAIERARSEQGAFENAVPIWGDDIRFFDAHAFMEITGMKPGELDSLEGSPPCFPAGTQVLCLDRVRPIEEVEVGHIVLTHEGRWRKVTNTMSRVADTVFVHGGKIEATPNHQFWARSIQSEGEGRENQRLSEPDWIAAEDLDQTFLSTPITAETEGIEHDLPIIAQNANSPEDFWRFVGLWVGDGWMRRTEPFVQRPRRGDASPEPRDCLVEECEEGAAEYERYPGFYGFFCTREHQKLQNKRERKELYGYGKRLTGVFLCSSHDEAEIELTCKILEDAGLDYGYSDYGTATRYGLGGYGVSNLADWLFQHFSRGAANKTIPGWMLTLPESQRRAFYEGYYQADGTKKGKDPWNGDGTFRSVSHSLAIGMKLVAESLGIRTGMIGSTFPIQEEPTKSVIEGRVVNNRQAFIVNTSASESDRFDTKDDKHRWFKNRGGVTEGREGVVVYDITVEEDHSFVADGYVVHNCKSFSMSGVRESGWGEVVKYSDERNQRTDDLFYEYVRLLRDFQPKTFIAENVNGLIVGEAATKMLVPLMKEFDTLGYRVDYRVVHASDHGVPQVRPRVFLLGVRKDLVDTRTGKYAVPSFPKFFDYAYTVGDVLDTVGDTNSAEELAFADITGTEAGKTWGVLQPGQAPKNKQYQITRCHPDLPSPTITQTDAANPASAGPLHPHECRKFTIKEYRYLFGFPTDYVLTGTLGQQGERLGRAVAPFLMKQLATSIAEIVKHAEVDTARQGD